MLSELEQGKVACFLFEAGHANPRFMGKYVIYRDQTRGSTAMDKLIESESILEHVRYLSRANIERLVKRLNVAQVTNESELTELDHYTNNPAKLLELAKDDVFERIDYFRAWADTFRGS